MMQIVLGSDSLVETTHEALCITKKRCEELDKMVGDFYDAFDTYPETIQQLGANVKSHNEFAYCVFILGAFAGSEKMRNDIINKVKE